MFTVRLAIIYYFYFFQNKAKTEKKKRKQENRGGKAYKCKKKHKKRGRLSHGWDSCASCASCARQLFLDTGASRAETGERRRENGLTDCICKHLKASHSNLEPTFKTSEMNQHQLVHGVRKPNEKLNNNNHVIY